MDGKARVVVYVKGYGGGPARWAGWVGKRVSGELGSVLQLLRFITWMKPRLGGSRKRGIR